MPQEQQPPRKVAKRVVVRRVVKRPPNGQPPATPAPRAPIAAKPSVRLGAGPARAVKSIGRRGRRAATASAGTGSAVLRALRDRAVKRYRAVRALPLPRLEETAVSAVVGAGIGLLTVAIAAALLMSFSVLRGVASGGGSWGSLLIVVVAFIAFALGEYFLAKFGVRQPRATSFLGLALIAIAIMAVFIGPIHSWWAWLIVPGLGAAAFALAHRLVAAAAQRED